MDINCPHLFSKANAIEVLAFIADASIAECRRRGLAWTMARIFAKQPSYTIQLVAVVRILAQDSSLMRAKSFGDLCKIHPEQFLESCGLIEKGNIDNAATCLEAFSREEQTYCSNVAKSLFDIFRDDENENIGAMSRRTRE